MIKDDLHPYDIYHEDEKPGAHWGDYQFVSHSHEQLGADPTVGHGDTIPGLDQMAVTDVRDGLTFVREDIRPAMIQALAFTAMQQQASLSDGALEARAYPIFTGATDSWLSDMVAQGNVIMLDMHKAQHGEAVFVFVKTPQQVQYYAGAPNGTPAKFAIVDGPAAVIDAAKAKPYFPPKPSPVEPVLPPQPSGMPDWAIPVGVGVGVLVIGGIVFAATRKRGR